MRVCSAAGCLTSDGAVADQHTLLPGSIHGDLGVGQHVGTAAAANCKLSSAAGVLPNLLIHSPGWVQLLPPPQKALK